MQISQAGGQTVAIDIADMFNLVDKALLGASQVTQSILETNASSSIPPSRLQPALKDAAAGFAKLVEGRSDMISMHKKLVLLKGESNLDVVDLGCFKFFFEGADSSVPVSA